MANSRSQLSVQLSSMEDFEWREEGYSLDAIMETLGISVSQDGSKTTSISKNSLSRLELTHKAPMDRVREEEKVARRQSIQLIERRMKVVQEMHKTEKTYTEFLQTAIMLFLTPLRKSAASTSPVCSLSDITIIFQNIEEICALNSAMLRKMAQRINLGDPCHGKWCDILLEAVEQPEFLDAYELYIHNYSSASEHLEHMLGEIRFAALMDEGLLNDLCQQASLRSFLVTPAQRLPRYILFAKDLRNCTPEDHPDSPDIDRLLKTLTDMTTKIHEAQDVFQKVARVESLYQRFDKEDQVLVRATNEPSRVFVGEGPILHRVGDKYHVLYCILFQDAIIAATQSKKGDLHLQWIAKLANSCLDVTSRTHEEDFLLHTQEKTQAYPFTRQRDFVLHAISQSPYDMPFWLELFTRSGIFGQDRDLLYRTGLSTKQTLGPKLVTRDDWDLLSVGAETRMLQPNDIAFDGKAEKDEVVLVQSGQLELKYELADGSQIVIDYLGPMNVVGTACILKKKSSLWTATAVIPSTVTCIKLKNLRSILTTDDALSGRFMQLVSISLAAELLQLSSQLLSKGNVDPQDLRVPKRMSSFRVHGCSNSTLDIVPPPSPKSRKTDKFLSKLGLPSEVILDQIPCKLKKGTLSYGTLTVMKEHISFTSKIFGHATRMVIPGKAICEVVARDARNIFVNHNKHTLPVLDLVFKQQEQKDRAFSLLRTFLPAKKMARNIVGSLERRTSFTLSSLERERLLRLAVKLKAAPGETIMKQGQLCRQVCQLLRGECEVVSKVDGEDKVVGHVKKNELFGEISLTLGTVATSSVRAVTEVKYLSFDRQKLEEAFHRDPGLATGFYTVIARQLHSRLCN